MDKLHENYEVEVSNGTYYVYNTDEYAEQDELVFIASSLEQLDNFCPGLSKLEKSFIPVEEYEQFDENRFITEKQQPKRRGWDPDENIKKAAKYYRDWAKFGEDEQLTEDLLKNEDWRLKRVSSLKNIPVKQLKAELLKQKDSE